MNFDTWVFAGHRRLSYQPPSTREVVDKVVDNSVMDLLVVAKVLDNSEFDWLSKASGGELRGADEGCLGLLDLDRLSEAAGPWSQGAVAASESQDGNAFLKLTVKNRSYVMKWMVDVERLGSGEGERHLASLADHNRPRGVLVEHLVQDDVLLELVEEEVAHLVFGCTDGGFLGFEIRL